MSVNCFSNFVESIMEPIDLGISTPSIEFVYIMASHEAKDIDDFYLASLFDIRSGI